jgi:hypothetical protein
LIRLAISSASLAHLSIGVWLSSASAPTVYGHLRDHDLLAVRTDAEKYLLVGVLNLVECVAFVGSPASAR